MTTDPPAYFDPRDPEQLLGSPSTWKPTRNPALAAAEHLAKCGLPVDWNKVAGIADSMDAPATALDGGEEE